MNRAQGATPLAAPIVLSFVEPDIPRLARRIAAAIAGTRRRREFATRFSALYARYVAGDQSAGGELWRLAETELAHPLGGWVLGHGHRASQDAIRDAITDAVVKALKLGTCDSHPIRDPRSWLLRSAWNRLTDGWRRARARPRLDAVGLDAELDQQATAHGAAAVEFVDPIAREDAGRLLHARLRAKCRTRKELRLVYLRYIDDAWIEQQAAAIGGGDLPRAEKTALVNRALKRIRARPERQKSGKRRRRS